MFYKNHNINFIFNFIRIKIEDCRIIRVSSVINQLLRLSKNRSPSTCTFVLYLLEI